MTRKRRTPGHRTRLKLEELFELGIGPYSRVPHERHLGPCDDFRCGGSVFPDEVTRRGLYFANRDELLADPQGSRPWGWWRYEAGSVCRHEPPCEHPPRVDSVAEARWLATHDVMEPAELGWVASWGRMGGIHGDIGRAVREVLDESPTR